VKIIRTEVGIDRPAAAVWAILVDIDRWPEWNPFAKAGGRLAVGERLKVEIRPPGRKPMTFRPTVVRLDPGVELRWLGHLGAPGISPAGTSARPCGCCSGRTPRSTSGWCHPSSMWTTRCAWR
jgi:hypothetical protein